MFFQAQQVIALVTYLDHADGDLCRTQTVDLNLVEFAQGSPPAVPGCRIIVTPLGDESVGGEDGSAAVPLTPAIATRSYMQAQVAAGRAYEADDLGCARITAHRLDVGVGGRGSHRLSGGSGSGPPRSCEPALHRQRADRHVCGCRKSPWAGLPGVRPHGVGDLATARCATPPAGAVLSSRALRLPQAYALCAPSAASRWPRSSPLR